MIPGKYSGLVTCVAAAGMGMFVAMWLLDFSVVRSNWCLGAETQCFRDWVGALSGWIAAAGALIAALLTIRRLKDQITDQKMQTKHLMGDGLPILEFNKIGDKAKITIKNYNRRRLKLTSIENKGDNKINVKIPNNTTIGIASVIIPPNTDKQYYGPECIIDGWETTNSPLPKYNFTVFIQYLPLEGYPPKLNVVFNWTLLDEFNTPIKLRVSDVD